MQSLCMLTMKEAAPTTYEYTPKMHWTNCPEPELLGPQSSLGCCHSCADLEAVADKISRMGVTDLPDKNWLCQGLPVRVFEELTWCIFTQREVC